MARFRQYNTVRTDTIENQIGLAWAMGDYSAVDAWRALARKVGAPIRESEIEHARDLHRQTMRRMGYNVPG